jgi:uncharacterized OB-fold protein
VRGLQSAAAYLPAGSAHGRRIASSDEDGLTLAVTTLERLPVQGNEGSGPIALDLLGAYPTSLDWALPVVLGTPVSITRAPSTGAELLTALRRAGAGAEGRAAVLVVELPERSDPPSAPTSSPGAGAAVFWFEEGTGSPLREALDSLPPGPTALGTALDLWRRVARADPESWVGDWAADPRAGQSVDPARFAPLLNLATSSVSEGAYVPRPRYLESLPSRWRFIADVCDACGTVTFPARRACRSCGRVDRLRSVGLPRDGVEVVAATRIGSGGQPTEFDPQVDALGPYGVVLVELSPGVRVTLQLADDAPGSIRIGDRVDTRLRRLYPMEGEWRYGRKAVPRSPDVGSGPAAGLDAGSHLAPSQLS